MPLSLDLGGSAIRIDVRTSKRARRFQIVSSINGVEAIVPPDYNAKDLESFVSSKRDWIIKISRYYSRLKERCGGLEPGTIYFLGNKYRFNVVKDRQRSVVVSDAMKVVTFHVIDRRRHKQDMEEWYREQTGRIIAERVPALAGRLGLRYNKVSIKSQRSRWASCSKKGNLNFNLLLAAAPPEVIDYVIIHELMHLVELDHSPRFWQLVKEAEPEYKKHKEWLASYAPVIKIG
ncbi:MAG TPA: SprT family zinc-dependent metalloprotease [Nitrososphaera sp.]|nr:SprT family zinc-dependent metalloprotease [Nitrososphaera sp.]